MMIDTRNPSVLGAAPPTRRDVIKAGAAAGLTAALLPAAAAAQGGLVALVHTQAAGDNGPVDSMIATLKKLSGEKGFQIRTIYAQDPATYESDLPSLGDAGAAVIATTFNEVAEPIKALAPAYPNTKWIQIFGDPFDPPMPNVVTVSYDYYLGCYLSGMFAAMISKTGKIGYIGGICIPPLNADLNAIKAAPPPSSRQRRVTGAFAGSFQDPAKGHEIASQMYQGGVDYIQTDSAATDTGIIQRPTRATAGMVSAISPAQYKIGPKTVDHPGGARFRPVALQRGQQGDRPRLQGRPRPRPASAPASSTSSCRRSSSSRARRTSSPRPRRSGRRSRRPKPTSSTARSRFRSTPTL